MIIIIVKISIMWYNCCICIYFLVLVRTYVVCFGLPTFCHNAQIRLDCSNRLGLLCWHMVWAYETARTLLAIGLTTDQLYLSLKAIYKVKNMQYFIYTFWLINISFSRNKYTICLSIIYNLIKNVCIYIQWI